MAKKLLIATTCAAVLAISGCASTNVIPGNRQLQISNVYIEYLNIADIYFSLEKIDKAITYYTYALDSKEIYWEAYYKLAKTYAVQKNWTEAEERYKRIYKRDPNNSSIKASLAYIYAMSGNTEQAKELYLELINNQEYNQDYYENYLSIIILEKDYSVCKAEYDKMADLFPESKNLEKFQKAIDEFKPVSEEEPSQSTTD